MASWPRAKTAEPPKRIINHAVFEFICLGDVQSIGSAGGILLVGDGSNGALPQRDNDSNWASPRTPPFSHRRNHNGFEHALWSLSVARARRLHPAFVHDDSIPINAGSQEQQSHPPATSHTQQWQGSPLVEAPDNAHLPRFAIPKLNSNRLWFCGGGRHGAVHPAPISEQSWFHSGTCQSRT